MDTALPLAELANLHFVTPKLAVGGDLSSEDDGLSRLQLAEISELGITHVVDTRLEWSDEQAVAGGFAFRAAAGNQGGGRQRGDGGGGQGAKCAVHEWSPCKIKG